MISFKLSEGKKPPLETKVIARLSELNNLIPEMLKRTNIKKLKKL